MSSKYGQNVAYLYKFSVYLNFTTFWQAHGSIGTGKRVFTGPLPCKTRVVKKSSFLYYLNLKYPTLKNPRKKDIKQFPTSVEITSKKN